MTPPLCERGDIIKIPSQPLILLYCTVLCYAVLCCALLCSALLCSPPLRSTPLHSAPLHSLCSAQLRSTPLHSTPLHSAPLRSTLLYSTLLYSTLLYSTLIYSTLLYSTLLYSTLLYSTLLYSTLLYSTLLYSTLLYSTLLYSTLIMIMRLNEMHSFSSLDWTAKPKSLSGHVWDKSTRNAQTSLLYSEWRKPLRNPQCPITSPWRNTAVTLDMKGCICHFTKWQIHPLISKGTIMHISRVSSINSNVFNAIQIHWNDCPCGKVSVITIFRI